MTWYKCQTWTLDNAQFLLILQSNWMFVCDEYFLNNAITRNITRLPICPQTPSASECKCQLHKVALSVILDYFSWLLCSLELSGRLVHTQLPHMDTTNCESFFEVDLTLIPHKSVWSDQINHKGLSLHIVYTSLWIMLSHWLQFEY